MIHRPRISRAPGTLGAVVAACTLAACGSSDPADVVPRAVRTTPAVTAPAHAPPADAHAATGDGPRGSCDDLDKRRLRGLSLRAATRLAGRYGCSTRVAEVDGRGRFLTDDLVWYRLDLFVRDDVVARAERHGRRPGRPR